MFFLDSDGHYVIFLCHVYKKENARNHALEQRQVF
jgi:hypothetical protein